MPKDTNYMQWRNIIKSNAKEFFFKPYHSKSEVVASLSRPIVFPLSFLATTLNLILKTVVDVLNCAISLLLLEKDNLIRDGKACLLDVVSVTASTILIALTPVLGIISILGCMLATALQKTENDSKTQDMPIPASIG